jgi:hypothetical protein
MSIKFKDIAHLYLWCELSSRGDAQGKLFAVDADGEWLISDGDGISNFRAEWNPSLKPILRHLDDITEEDARGCYKAAYGMEWKDSEGSAIEYMAQKDEWYAPLWVLDLGKSSVWTYLLSRHYDLHGLIKAGEALRKEVGNG